MKCQELPWCNGKCPIQRWFSNLNAHWFLMVWLLEGISQYPNHIRQKQAVYSNSTLIKYTTIFVHYPLVPINLPAFVSWIVFRQNKIPWNKRNIWLKNTWLTNSLTFTNLNILLNNSLKMIPGIQFPTFQWRHDVRSL